ncbi:hypothetical protein G2W53_005148 [Senna tora]|uniref:Uncharacterized protein n=1 Tax=Senna tora TaxID=362788 RepID=A0A835CJZ0_9FABA|nr:hypothetical protein G2W53_005148 [Senna tora]
MADALEASSAEAVRRQCANRSPLEQCTIPMIFLTLHVLYVDSQVVLHFLFTCHDCIMRHDRFAPITLHYASKSAATSPVCSCTTTNTHSPQFDSIGLIRHFENSIFNLLVHSRSRLYERFINIHTSFRRNLHEHQSTLLRELFSFLHAHFPFGFVEIALVPDQRDRQIRIIGSLPRVLHPRRQVIERLSPAHVVDEQRRRGCSVIRPPQGSERLLARRVPDLDLDRNVLADLDDSAPEFGADG